MFQVNDKCNVKLYVIIKNIFFVKLIITWKWKTDDLASDWNLHGSGMNMEGIPLCSWMEGEYQGRPRISGRIATVWSAGRI